MKLIVRKLPISNKNDVFLPFGFFEYIFVIL